MKTSPKEGLLIYCLFYWAPSSQWKNENVRRFYDMNINLLRPETFKLHAVQTIWANKTWHNLPLNKERVIQKLWNRLLLPNPTSSCNLPLNWDNILTQIWWKGEYYPLQLMIFIFINLELVRKILLQVPLPNEWRKMFPLKMCIL